MKRCFATLLGLFLVVGLGQADWKYNPFTGKLDYYEAGTDAKVGVDAAATADYFGVDGTDGMFRFTANHFTMADGGDFVTLSLADHDTARAALGLEIGVDVPVVAHTMASHSDEDTYDISTSGTLGAGGPFTLTQTSDTFVLSHDGTNAYFKTSDGHFVFQTDEGTNADTTIDIKPKGTSETSGLVFFDADGARLSLYTTADRAFIVSSGGNLGLQASTPYDIQCWEYLTSGNPSINIYGWNTAGGDRESTELTMDDTNDEFLIQAANSANHEGVTVSLPEANQAFRVRNGAGIVASVANDGEVFNVSQYGTMQTATGDGTTTVDWGLGNIMYFTFGAQNDAFTFTPPANKGDMKLIIKQDGTGSRTMDWSGVTVLWPGDVEPTLSTGANAVDVVTFIYDGTSYLGLFNGDFR